MTIECVVRPASATQAPIIATFNQAMAQETESRQLPSDIIGPGVAAVFANPSLGRYFVAEHDGNVVGCLLITYEWSDWRNGLFWWIQSVYVLPHARSQGVFRAMYAAIKSQAQAQDGVCGLRLYVEQDNVNAQAIYSSVGMERTAYQLFEEVFTQ
jgi:ribosomal protein S18 acetylase RimI-like enzyme